MIIIAILLVTFFFLAGLGQTSFLVVPTEKEVTCTKDAWMDDDLMME
jgi:hypothetical protein